MLKILLKKQLYQLNSFLFQNRKTGKRRSVAGIIGYCVLYAFIFLLLAFSFFGLAAVLGEQLLTPGFMAGHANDWLYFAMMGVMTMLLGAIGSVFTTYTAIYVANDNELLLAMPIKPNIIVLSRLAGVYLMSLAYTSVVWLPACVYYWITMLPTIPTLVFPLLLGLLLPLFVAVISCVLGYVLALIANRLKNKSIVITLLTTVFFVGYYYVCFRLNTLISALVLQLVEMGDTIKSKIWLLWQLGRGAAGDARGLLIFGGITIAMAIVCFIVLSKTFTKIVTTNRGAKKTVYKETTAKVGSVKQALLRREVKNFVSKSAWFLNAGLGNFLMLALAVAAIVKKDSVLLAINMLRLGLPQLAVMLPMIVTAMVMMITGMDAISASAVSMEGESLWVARSLPVSTADILEAKRNLHVLFNLPATLITGLVLGLITGLSIYELVLMEVILWVYVWLSAEFGLMLNLWKANVNWVSVNVVVKSSLPVTIALFGGWLFSLLMPLAGWLLRNVTEAETIMAVFMVLEVLLVRLLRGWVTTKGAEHFEAL